jgi:hypothetical protein
MITFKDYFTFRKNRAFWLQIAAMAATQVIVPFIVLCWLDVYTHHGEAVTVPSVKGQLWSRAFTEIEASKLRAMVVDSSYVKGKPTGCVLEQNPAGGAQVKEGRTVYLTINAKTVPTVTMPDVMDNSSLRQAEAKLRAMGFRLTEPQYVSGERDWVYSVKYNGREVRAGEKIPHEALLTLCVGGGDHIAHRDSTETDGEIYEETAPQNGGQQTTHEERAKVDESWF